MGRKIVKERERRGQVRYKEQAGEVPKKNFTSKLYLCPSTLLFSIETTRHFVRSMNIDTK